MAKNKKMGTGKKVLIAILVILLLLIIGGVAIFEHYYQMSNRVKDDEVIIVDVDTLDLSEDEGIDDVDLSDDEEDELRELAAAEFDGISNMKGIYNMLLIGSDRRTPDWYGNSDVMVLVTLNSNTDTLYMTSFMRDLYADIPGVGVRKLNNAYARGGGPLLVKTLQQNYGVVIDNYASVDFQQMTNVIDLIGGVDINLTAAEAKWIGHGLAEVDGVAHLNGEQAVLYQRNRSIGNSDFKRTSRQRTVLQAIFAKIKSMGATEAVKLVDDLLPLVTHNVDEMTVLKLIGEVPNVLKYDVVENRIPYDGQWTDYHEILIPTSMEKTVKQLRDTIYATK